MSTSLSLMSQTTYAELLERCASSAFKEAFEQGVFVSKTIKGKRYWYFQSSTEKGRVQKYVGPETPELMERVSLHQAARDDSRERRALVSALMRSFGLPAPLAEMGAVISALAKAGVFRLRGVLVGTMAYQAYSAMLGLKLPLQFLQTTDIDIAQFKNISVAVQDQTVPMLDVLKSVDKKFRAVPHTQDSRKATSYVGSGGVRVDFLTPNDGPNTDRPQTLKSFGTEAQPLRFLSYLIHKTEPAVILYDDGVYVSVPPPERYALHKLIISRRRIQGSAKRDKDIQQAESLLMVLAEKRSYELREGWKEACRHGRKWRQLLLEGVQQLSPKCRELVLQVVEEHL